MHLRTLARVDGREVQIEVGEPTVRGVIAALEGEYPMLRGTIRDQQTGERRPFLRFFAEERDLSHQGMECPLPASVLEGREALLVIGAIAGG
jgi:hypothetical protein